MSSSKPTSSLGLYTSNLHTTPSVFEIKNQLFMTLQFILWFYLYYLYGQQVWHYMLQKFDFKNLGFFITFTINNILFYSLGAFFFILDSYPQYFGKYRIQNFRPVKTGSYAKVLKTVLFNSLVVGFLFGYFSYEVYKLRMTGVDLRILPSYQQIILHHLAFVLLQEIGFYYSHRLLHKPYFYKLIHKKHHQFQAPIAISAIYAHPIQHIVSNLMPLFLGPFVMKSHIITYWIWLSLAITTTMINHSDYCLPGLSNPVNHDFHHYVQQENFGVLGILDRLHETDVEYQKMLKMLNQKLQKQA